MAKLTYQVITGPPKPPDQLAPQEGLADYLIVHSIMGEPGEGPMLSGHYEMRVNGEAVQPSLPLEYRLAAFLLAACEQRGHPLAKAGMDAIRKAMGLK